MKKLLIALLCLLATPAYSYSTAQQAQLGALTTGGVFTPYSSTFQLPINVYDASNSAGDCLISNGSASAATFQACSGGGGGSTIAIQATTTSTALHPLMAITTGSAVSTAYIDLASPWSYTPSTGTTGILAISTTGLIVNGNSSLTGTTTLGTAQILAGNAIFTTVTGTNGNLTNVLSTTITGTTGNFPKLNFTNALGTTITATTGNLTNVLATTITATTANLTNEALSGTSTIGTLNVTTNATLAGTTTVNNISITGTCVGCTATPAAGSIYNIQYNNGSNAFAANAGLNVSTTRGGIDFLANVTTANLLSLGNNGADVTSYALGESALLAQTTTNRQNTAIGAFALAAVTTGTNNTSLGFDAGQTITTGTNNTVIGSNVGQTTLTVGSGNILIGVNNAIDTTTTATSNTINIGGTGGSWVNVAGTNTVASEITTMNGALNTSVTSATAFTVGQTGTTNPTVTIDTSTVAGSTGIDIKSAATGGQTLITATDSSANAGITFQAKGTGALAFTNPGNQAMNFRTNNVVALTIGSGQNFTFGSNPFSGNTVRYVFNTPADTALTASTNVPNLSIGVASTARQHSTGALALQSDYLFTGTIDSFVGSSTLTNGAALEVAGPKGCGTNGTCTNESAIYVPSIALTTTGAITNSYGLNASAATGATNNYAASFTGQTVFSGHTNYTGTAPVISACGTSPSIDANATDNSGTVTVGTVAAASCTITFATAYASYNHCRVDAQTGGLAAFAYSYTLSAITVTGTSLVGALIDYDCDGK